MSHQIKVEGNFGTAKDLMDELDSQNIRYNEVTENGDDFLTFPDGKYNQYGNPLRINLTNPASSTMDSDIGRVVGLWYRGAKARQVKNKLAMQGVFATSEKIVGQNVVLRVAIG